jgi:WD40 repeat protein
VRLWDIRAEKERAAFTVRHPAYVLARVTSLAFSPDGKTLAAGVARRTLDRLLPGEAVVWDVTTGKELCALPGLGTSRPVVTFTEGTTLAVADTYRGMVRLFEGTTGKETGALRKPGGGGLISLAVSPDARLLAAGEMKVGPRGEGLPVEVTVWDLQAGQLAATLKGHVGVIYALAFSPDGRTLASAGTDRIVRLWEAATGGELAAYEGHAGTVFSVAFAASGCAVATVGDDRSVKLWDITEALDRKPGGRGG